MVPEAFEATVNQKITNHTIQKTQASNPNTQSPTNGAQ